MARLVVLEGDHNCINHATGGDDYDLSVEELRFLRDESFFLMAKKRPFLTRTSPVIYPNCPPPPIRHNYRFLGRVVKEIVLSSSSNSQRQLSSYYTAATSPTTADDNNINQVHDVIAIDDDDDDDDNDNNNNNDNDVTEFGEEEDFVESSVVSSVASNDYAPLDASIDEVQSVFVCDSFGFTRNLGY